MAKVVKQRTQAVCGNDVGGAIGVAVGFGVVERPAVPDAVIPGTAILKVSLPGEVHPLPLATDRLEAPVRAGGLAAAEDSRQDPKGLVALASIIKVFLPKELSRTGPLGREVFLRRLLRFAPATL